MTARTAALLLAAVLAGAAGCAETDPAVYDATCTYDDGVVYQGPSCPAMSSPGPIVPLTAKDFLLRVALTDKQCYGATGCNLRYEIEVTVGKAASAKLAADARPYAITYEVTGGEYGPALGTLNLQPDGTYSGRPAVASTRKQSSALSVKVVDVTMRNGD